MRLHTRKSRAYSPCAGQPDDPNARPNAGGRRSLFLWHPCSSVRRQLGSLVESGGHLLWTARWEPRLPCCSLPSMSTGAAAGRDADRFVALGDGERVPYPAATSPAVSQVMRGNRSRDTRPEQAVRSELFRRGLRYRKHFPIDTDLRRVRPDVVFPRQRIAVFIDGCFWHSCPEHGAVPRVNTSYWSAKLARTRDRDFATTGALQRAGWTVVRLWEHDLPGGVEQVVRAVHGS